MIATEHLEGTLVARLTGDIDMANIRAIEDAIATEVKSDAFGLVVDLSAVTYLDSSGIRLIYRLDERAADRQQRFVLIIPTGAQVTRTLEAAGVIGTVPIVTTTEQALEAIRAT